MNEVIVNKSGSLNYIYLKYVLNVLFYDKMLAQ